MLELVLREGRELRHRLFGKRTGVVTEALFRIGARDWMGHASSFGAVGLCIGLWIRAKTVDQDERGNAERRALFVGLWAPTLWVMGDSLREHEQRRRLLPRLLA